MKFVEGFRVFVKLISLPPFAGFFIQSEKTAQAAFTEDLDLLTNPNMNNLGHIDFCSKDWTTDNDFALARYS